MSKYELLNKNTHANMRLSNVEAYSFASVHHVVSVVLHEFVKISINYPIVFVKSADQGKFHPMALLGLEPGRNIFIDAAGAWRPGYYIPAAFRRYPFALTDNGQGEMAICIDTESKNLNFTDGELLIDAQGEITPSMAKISGFLHELMNSESMAASFCERLVALNLLSPCDFKVKGPEGEKVYGGSYIIDENKLTSLDDDSFLSLRQAGFLGPIYAHVASLMQIEKLSAFN
jgi:SapC